MEADILYVSHVFENLLCRCTIYLKHDTHVNHALFIIVSYVLGLDFLNYEKFAIYQAWSSVILLFPWQTSKTWLN